MFFGVLITAIWKELYFRYIGKTLFEKDGKYTITNILFLAIAFALSYLINIFFYNSLSVLIQMIIAFGFTVFAIALEIIVMAVVGIVILKKYKYVEEK